MSSVFYLLRNTTILKTLLNKTNRQFLKEFDLKNDFQLIYLLYIFADFTNEYETFMKNYIEKTFQEQVAQLELTEATNDTPVSTQAQSIETEIFENIKHQSIDMELNDQNTEHQSEDVIAETLTKNSSKSYTKLNAKAISYTLKGKGCTVTFAEMASRNLDIGSEHDTFLYPVILLT
ncbi:unnamed protein product [Rhizophagus irregularis]|nr:unnamed protein product [Rhizophagus irregularis]